MLTGISTYTYTWAFGVPGSLPSKPMDVFALLDKAAEQGVDCIQIADNYPLIDQKSDELSASGIMLRVLTLVLKWEAGDSPRRTSTGILTCRPFFLQTFCGW